LYKALVREHYFLIQDTIVYNMKMCNFEDVREVLKKDLKDN